MAINVKIPLWLIRSAVTTAYLTPCVLQADGGLDEKNGGQLIGRLDEVQISARNTTENISPMDSRHANHVITEGEVQFTLTEILQNNGNAAVDNVLALASMYFDYVRITFARDGMEFDMYGVIGDYTEEVRKGKSLGHLTILPVMLTEGMDGQNPPQYDANPWFGVPAA